MENNYLNYQQNYVRESTKIINLRHTVVIN